MAVNGSLLKISIDDQVVTCQTEATLNLSTETRDVTCKDANSLRVIKPALKAGTLSGTAFIVEGPAQGFDSLFEIWNNSTQMTWKFSDDVSGSSYYNGVGYITSLERSGGVEDNQQFSFEIAITGITKVAIP